MSQSQKLLPPWLLAFGNLPLGINSAVCLITIPDMLAAAHVPEGQIATATSLFLSTGFISILLAPLLDWRLPRRTYAIGFAVLNAVCNFFIPLAVSNIPLLTVLMFLSGMANAMCISAMGGWFSDLVPKEKKDALGAWFTVINFGAGGILAALIMYLLHELPSPLGEAATAVLSLLVVILFYVTPCPPADKTLASESFRNFARDVSGLFRRKEVLWVMLIFIAPSASFALTNTLSGFGHIYHISDEMVGVLGGAGVAVAGVAGALLVPLITKRLSPVATYLLVGLIGAVFTLTLIPAPKDPTFFGVAILGQNLFQAAAFAAANVITLRAIGHDNPLAATQYSVLIGVTMIPLTYMQMADGHAFDFGGLAGTFATDALVSGAACLILGLLYWRFGRRSMPDVETAAPVPASPAE
ncbi:MFS transporter [Kordiimonas marina]|uniref:MFS transporter n=1 Tax=Kordiimonas marina TaxID=2872312 RepID=UPI001FF2E993|nr:MFS transporter [Kordiimonas marina]MCJ9430208.1 MFS transporter [Kordiimonas marina]